MKNIALIALCAAAAAFCAQAATEAELGGNLEIWPSDHGLFMFVNAQSAVPREVVERNVSRLATDFNIDARLADGQAPAFGEIPAAKEAFGAKLAVWIVDDQSLPVSLAATVDGWAFLNVSRMVLDKPDAKKLSARFARFFNRSFAEICGIGDSSMMPQCVMRNAVGFSGVDALVTADFSPEAFSKISSYLSLAGYKGCRRGTYYDACEEGWAPAPTNDVQKAIWDKVHQMPTQPMKIQPKSKRRGGK